MQKPVGHFIRAVLLMPLYVPLFAPKAASSATAGSVYTIVLKVRPSPQLQEGPCHAGCAAALSVFWPYWPHFLLVVFCLVLLWHLKWALERCHPILKAALPFPSDAPSALLKHVMH